MQLVKEMDWTMDKYQKCLKSFKIHPGHWDCKDGFKPYDRNTLHMVASQQSTLDQLITNQD